ncbi:unnamed protein product, partial [Musa textilis]
RPCAGRTRWRRASTSLSSLPIRAVGPREGIASARARSTRLCGESDASLPAPQKRNL